MQLLRGKNKFIQHAAVVLILYSSGILYAQDSYFYSGKNYGSEAAYNPLTLILNGSYDIIQFEKSNRNIGSYPYYHSSKNVFKNLSEPINAVNNYGWKNFLRDQILPFDFSPNHGQWWANYNLHLFGGGMTYVQMSEWYQYHGFENPQMLSIGTMVAYHLLNEAVENGNHKGYNVDPIADIYFFDIGGILLFSNNNVKEFFSKTLNMTDWSLQPSFSLRQAILYNNGQYFSFKWKIPFQEKFYLFYFTGIDGLFGASYKINNEDMISSGVGLRAKHLVALEKETHRQTVNLVWNFGIFYDRNNSLLVSLFFAGSYNDVMLLNIYPGIFHIGDFSPGFFVTISRNGLPVAGITTQWTPGIAFGKY